MSGADAAAALYDALQVLESRWRGKRGYPVHKTLRAAGEGARDVYDWVAERLDLPAAAHILDAGCGSGYGTLRLACRTRCRVTGISVSAREIDAACAALPRSDAGERVRFRRASFDDLPLETYDAIVAVESLKHSDDLRRSVRSMLAALKPGGMLLLVEDLWRGGGPPAAVQGVLEDWRLARLYSEADYAAALGPEPFTAFDLTPRVRRSSSVSRVVKRALLDALVAAAPGRVRTALAAFRGGVCLEQLYAADAMRYAAIVCQPGRARLRRAAAEPRAAGP